MSIQNPVVYPLAPEIARQTREEFIARVAALPIGGQLWSSLMDDFMIKESVTPSADGDIHIFGGLNRKFVVCKVILGAETVLEWSWR